jgi:NitT/TauT family transport system ATP-binding protein
MEVTALAEAARQHAPQDPHVVIADLSKIYELKGDRIESIRRVSFALERGGFLSIVGPSGCGKSTLLMILAGIIPPSAGAVLIGASPVTGPRRATSLMFQVPALFPWRSVLGNVLFPIEIFKGDLERHRAEALKLLEMTGLIEFKDRLPEQLSGGMAQRVSLCRALITNPELLLMDEPFSALDALTRDEMGLELLNIWEKFRKTVVFVTHSIREAVFLSDRVIVFTPRPAVIGCDLRVDLPRPRTLEIQEAAEFNRYCAEIRANIGVRGE